MLTGNKNMKILIVEDELAAAENLTAVLNEIDSNLNIIEIIDNIADAVNWISGNSPPDLAFFDIYLSDGSSFEIFSEIDVDFPVVFTTAYDEYALNAFNVNCIDYVLKPVSKKDIERSIEKYTQLKKSLIANDPIIKELASNNKKEYKQTILIQNQRKYIPVPVEDFLCFYIKNEVVYGYTLGKEKYIIDLNLESLDNQLNPDNFFRANRQQIIARKAIKEVEHFFHGRLAVIPQEDLTEQIIISKGRVPQFKQWLDN